MRAPVSATAEPFGSARRLLCFCFAALALACALPASAAALQFVQAPGSPYGFDSEDSSSLAVGDLDGDGRDDLVTANDGPLFANQPSYTVLGAAADGSLAVAGPGAVPLPGYAAGIALGDFDADEVLDLAVALQAGGAGVYLGDGSGGFATSPTAVLATGANPSAIEAADLDGDGNDDLAIANFASADVSVHYGVGDGTFVEPEASPFPVGAEEPRRLAVGDFDGDGLGDIATANLDETGISEKSISVLLAEEDGDYAAAPGSPLSGEYRSQDVAVGHVDAGPTLDLVTVSSPNNGIVVKLGAGDGTFTDAPGGPFSFPSRLTQSLAVADLNGDGRDDVSLPVGGSIGEVADDTVWVFESAADGSLAAAEGNPYPVWPAQFPDSIAAGDFNGDGTPDLVTENLSQNLTVLLRDDAPQPDPVLEPESIGFGLHMVGSTSEPEEIVVRNDGPGALPLSGLELVGGSPDQFSLDLGDCGPTLAGGEECTVEVSFAPTGIGWITASLRMPRPLGPPAQVFLEGEAEDVASATISPTEKDFGSLEVFEGPTGPETFYVENTSQVRIEIESVSIEGANPDDFEIEYDSCEGEYLWEEGEYCEIDVSFNPQAAGERSAELTIVSPDLEAPLTASLTGTGEAFPGIFAYPNPWEAGSAPVGTADGPTEWINLLNDGSGDLEVGAAALAGANPGDFEILTDECSGEVVEPWNECWIEVQFSPTGAGPRSATLQIPSNVPGGPTEVTLEGSGEAVPGASLTPTSHDFGAVAYKVPSAPQVFTLESTGSAALEVTSVQLTDTSDGFEILDDGCVGATLEPSETCAVEVALSPQSFGPLGSELQIATNAAGSPLSATLTGAGSDNPQISLTPSSHDFGERVLGSGPSASQTFTIESTGTTDLQLSAIGIVGDVGDFHFSESCPATLAPAATCEIQVAFEPGTAGARAAQLSVASDAPASPATSALAGTGVAREAELTIAPGDHDFGGLAVGGESAPQAFEVESSGNVPVTIASLNIAGEDEEDFIIDDEDCFGEELAPTASCEIDVVFLPSAIGAREAELRVGSADLSGPATASLSGTGLANAGIAVDPESLEFGEAVLGNDAIETMAVSVESTGTTALEVEGAALAGPGSDQFSVSVSDSCDVPLAPGGVCHLNVAFFPTAVGVHEAVLEIANDSATPSLAVPVSGTTVAPPQPPQPPEPPKPPVQQQQQQPPSCPEPVVGQPAAFVPQVKDEPGVPGVRARFAIDGPTALEVRGQIRYRLDGKARTAALETRTIEALGSSANYKVALPARLRQKLRPGAAVTLKLRYRSRNGDSACTAFGPERRKSVATKVVWIQK